MSAPLFVERIDQATASLVKLRSRVDKLTQEQAKKIFAATLPFVEQTKIMLKEARDAADIDWKGFVAAGVTMGVTGIAYVGYNEDKWIDEADYLYNWLTTYSSEAVSYLRTQPQSEWTAEGLLTVTDRLLSLSRDAWVFGDRFSTSIYATLASVLHSASNLIDALLRILKNAIDFVVHVAKGAGTALEWVGPLLGILIPIAAIGGLIYLAKTGAGAIREAGTPGHTRLPKIPWRGKARGGGRALPPPDPNYDFT